jgi:glucose-1-phosphate cytidylyltransferase
MLPVCGRPIIIRVMEIYAAQGFRDFVLSVGYRKEVILDYFDRRDLGLSIEIVDTGDTSDTGDRVFNLRERLTEPFMVTYADGLCDVDLRALNAFHAGHGAPVTVTNMPLRSQYGTVDLDGSGRVLGFREKPVLSEHRINVGYMVMDPSVFDHWEGRNMEQEVFPALASKGLIYSYAHEGFFKSMDTFKDQQEIERLAEGGEMPWMRSAPGGDAGADADAGGGAGSPAVTGAAS